MNKRDQKTRQRRLTVLRDHLAWLPGDVFDLERWMRPYYTRTSCGAAGCALGHACLIPSFRKAGLRLVDYRPTYRDLERFEAGAEFFKLSRAEAVFLFDPSPYKGVVEGKRGLAKVIRRINWLLSKAPRGKLDYDDLAQCLTKTDRRRLHVQDNWWKTDGNISYHY